MITVYVAASSKSPGSFGPDAVPERNQGFAVTQDNALLR